MRLPTQLWFYRLPTDMRRSYTGLATMVRHELGHDPLDGHGFVFINRRRTQLKCLYFEAGGYCIWSKRRERGRFGMTGAGTPRALSPAEFEALVEGLDWVVTKRRKRWQKHPLAEHDAVQ